MTEGSRVRRIALTGGIATGKSHVRARLEALGVPTIDADTLARDVVAPGTPGFGAVVERFGPNIVAPDGSLNRRALAAIVFADATARHALEDIIHPAVRKAMDQWFESLDPRRFLIAVADIPLLFETGRDKEFDAVILTITSPSLQLQRLMQRDGLTEAEASLRVSSQLPSSDKERRATYVIDTNGTREETDRQIDDLYRRLVG